MILGNRIKQEVLLAENIQGVGRAGERVTLELRAADVHDPTEIPSYLAGYHPYPFRAEEASPVILRNNDEDKYRSFSEEDAFQPIEVKTDPSAAHNEVSPRSALLPYKVVSRVVGSFVPKVTELQESTFDPFVPAARRCKWAIDMDRELDVFKYLLGDKTLFDASVVTTLGANRNWNGGSSATPILDLQNQIEASWQPVDGIWMNQKVGHAFFNNSDVREYMKAFQGEGAASSTAAQVTQAGKRNIDVNLVGFPPIHIVASKYKPAGASAPDYIFPDVVTLVASPPEPMDGEEIATTYTFRRRGPSGTGFETREYFIDGRGELGGTMLVTSMADIAILTGDKVGGVIDGVYLSS